jgi:FKBP-type peptidyl-prolyl cis-trans isomerase SlpA
VINTFNEKPATLSLGAGELSPAMEDKLIGLAEGTHHFRAARWRGFWRAQPRHDAVGGPQAHERARRPA